MPGRGTVVMGLVALALAGAPSAMAAPSPELGKTALLNAESGTVLVKEKGKSGFARLPRKPTLVRMPATVDATGGDVRVRTARGNGRADNNGVFWEGSFVLTQDNNARGLTQLRLTGGDAGVCAGRQGSPAVKQQLWGNGKGKFKSKGQHGSGSSRGTKWLTQDRCDGTRIAVQDGLVETDTQDGELVFEVSEDQVVQYRCDLQGVEPVSDAFCTSVYTTPSIGLWGAGILTKSNAATYDLCLTDPSGEERCEPHPLSPPDEDGFQDSIVFCQADRGPGAYSLRWLIDGVQLGPPLGFEVEQAVGQGCTSQP
jgi:hypothetical protein